MSTTLTSNNLKDPHHHSNGYNLKYLVGLSYNPLRRPSHYMPKYHNMAPKKIVQVENIFVEAALAAADWGLTTVSSVTMDLLDETTDVVEAGQVLQAESPP